MGYRLWLGMMIITCWVVPGTLLAEVNSPSGLVRDLVKTISSFKQSTNGRLSESDRAHNMAAAKQANTILDIPSVSKQVLGRYWKKRTPVEQQRFTEVFTELLVRVAYPKSSTFFSDFDVKIIDERVTGQRAVVNTTVSDPKEGLISVDFKLQKQRDAWQVRDIILDDVSLARNLRSQCQKIIAEHSYDELLRRMLDKLKDESAS